MMDANNEKKRASQTGKIEDADCGAATSWTISMPTNKKILMTRVSDAQLAGSSQDC